MLKTTLEVTGMHCRACVDRLTKAFQQVPGVSAAHISLDPPRAELETTEPVPPEALMRAAQSAGRYTIRAIDAPARNGAADHEASGHAANPHASHQHPSAVTTLTTSAPSASSTTPVSVTAARPVDMSAVPIDDTTPKPSLYPLILIVAFIAGVAGLATIFRGSGDWPTFMNDFMAGFFLVFSFFKLLDLRGFAGTYRMYDLPARVWPTWGYIYPFVELALGVAYLIRFAPTATNIVTLVLMLVGSAGVLRALLKKNAIRCACLGTALNLPMTTVTLVEDLAMALMAAVMLGWPH